MFPSASPIGKIADLPELVRRKLSEGRPARSQILEAYCEFLKPFAPAGYNDWTIKPDDREIVAYADLFSALSGLLEARETRSIVAVS
jgi:hypothetical protein